MHPPLLKSALWWNLPQPVRTYAMRCASVSPTSACQRRSRRWSDHAMRLGMLVEQRSTSKCSSVPCSSRTVLSKSAGGPCSRCGRRMFSALSALPSAAPTLTPTSTLPPSMQLSALTPASPLASSPSIAPPALSIGSPASSSSSSASLSSLLLPSKSSPASSSALPLGIALSSHKGSPPGSNISDRARSMDTQCPVAGQSSSLGA
mmetsp:Transcript_20866/g.64704  ORF Transcript_20866/g.64704 Transcript_20866/m.64704 type:complete len:205 (+) Transcript_20866:561-1175(+)